MKRLLKFFFVLNLILAVVTLLSYLSPFANPRVLWPISVLAVFYPWLLMGNILFVFFWLVYKMRYMVVSILVIGLGFNHFDSLIGFSSRGYKSSPTQFEIMSFNTQNLYYIFADQEHRQERMEEFFNFFKKFDHTDLLCAQEVGARTVDLVAKRTGFVHYYAPESIGPAIFSKHPLINTGQIHSSTSTVNSCVWADVNINGNVIRLYNLHMQSNKITRTAEKVIEETNFQSRETWNGIKSIITRYRDNANFRIEHAERIRMHMLESPYPVIIAGDFNDVPQSYLYRILALGMQDSFRKAGSGLGITFSGKIPALRIDYIFADRNFEILQHEIISSEVSDHYPISSIINLKP